MCRQPVAPRRCIEWESVRSEQAAQLSSSAVEPGNHGSDWGAHDLSDFLAPEAFDISVKNRHPELLRQRLHRRRNRVVRQRCQRLVLGRAQPC
jgi:hypothetical protein